MLRKVFRAGFPVFLPGNRTFSLHVSMEGGLGRTGGGLVPKGFLSRNKRRRDESRLRLFIFPLEKRIFAAVWSKGSLADNAAADEGLGPTADIGFGLLLADAETPGEHGGSVGNGEVFATEGVPQQQGGGVEGYDLGHVGLGFSLLDDQVFAGNLAYLVVVFDAHDVLALKLEWRKYRHF